MTVTRGALLAIASIMPMACVATANAQTIEVLTEPHARSMVILRIALDELPDDQAVYVELKAPNDADYRELYLFSSDYGAISGNRFATSMGGERVLTVPAFLSYTKTWENAKHTFDVAGRYSLRLAGYSFETRGGAARKQILFEVQVDFVDPAESDLQYFAHVKQAEVWSQLGITEEHAELMNRIIGSLIGLGLVQEVVQTTLRVGDSTHGKSEWADPLYDLAFAVPDSSYAPYVAYYAACSYMWQRKNAFVKSEYGYELPDERVVQLEHYQKAHKALELAVERGDPYIKPFATLFLAALKAWAADYAGARTLIESLDAEAQTSSQIARMAAEVDHFVRSKELESKE